MTRVAREALATLQAGNRRFAGDPGGSSWALQGQDLKELVAAQRPIAAVLGCSDSRVPVEIVFGQGPGQLFVVRVAGNVVAPTQLGSLEFAVTQLGVRLIVVLGHSGCGAVEATLRRGAESAEGSENLNAITGRIGQHIAQILEGFDPQERVALLGAAVRENVRAGCRELSQGSAILRRFVHEEGLLIVGAVYDVSSGGVEFL